MRVSTLLLLSLLASAAACQSTDPVKIDEPEWHEESADGDGEAAAGHIVLFYMWAVDHDLVPAEWPRSFGFGTGGMVLDNGRTAQEVAEDQYRSMRAAVRRRDPNAMGGALEEVAEGLFSDHFTAEAAPFATSCYEAYLNAFHAYVGRAEGDLAAATWEQFDLVAPHLDALYAQHPDGGCE